MAKQKATSVPPAELRLYERLVKATKGAELKSNFGSAYTAVNGNMYSMISKHGLVGIRLPKAEREAFIREYKTELFRADPAWPPAKEYVAVPARMLTKTAALRPYMEASLAYARSLKPKQRST